MNEDKYDVSIRIAGNTSGPCVHALLSKGYKVTLEYVKVENPDDPWYPFQPYWDAEKGRTRFSAVSPEELLGLIAMWEMRGNDWFMNDEEKAQVNEVYDAAVFLDGEGNIIDEENILDSWA